MTDKASPLVRLCAKKKAKIVSVNSLNGIFMIRPQSEMELLPYYRTMALLAIWQAWEAALVGLHHLKTDSSQTRMTRIHWSQ